MSAHKDWQPEKVRSGLKHPVIDGDGHWIEYGPVFAEQVRKAAGDKAADGLLRHMRRIPDVPDMRMVLPEAHELVEDGLITADDFRDFTFANAVRLWGTQNPDFFKGTVVARQAAEVLNRTPIRAAAE